MSDSTVGNAVNLVLTGYAWWLMIPASAVLGVLIARLYMKETEGFGNGGMWLRMLRAAVVVILVLLLSQPIIHRVTALHEPPVVIVLRDQSTSMSVKDTHEPIEKKVRAAVVLGLLDGKLRDLNAENAVTSLTSALTALESATGGVRQAMQQLQESGESSAGIQERLTQARKYLSTLAAESRKAADLLAAAPLVQPHQKPAALKAAEMAAALDKDLSEVPLKNADARKFLMDKSQSLKALKQDLTRVTADARKLQDRVDRALGESGKQPVKTAIEAIDKMDRITFTTAILDKSTTELGGEQARIVSYNIDTDLRSPDGKFLEREPDKNESKDAKPEKRTDARQTRADTDLATPLLRLLEKHAHDTVTSIVLCSDGRHTSGPAPEDAARAIAARGITLHSLGVGSTEAPPDICVARLDGTLSVFLEETIRLTAQIKCTGLKNQKCKLALKSGDKTIQERVLAIGSDGWLTETFELTATKSGPNAFTASIEPLPGEALTTNNSADAVVDVANDRLKVLVVDELPRWETRYVASLLRRERKMELKERWLISGDGMGPRPKALPEEQKGLEEYDIIVLGDVMAERLDDAAQKRLARYVADNGGFLVVIAGNKAMPRAYPSGPLADLLPIKQQLTTGAAAMLTADATAGARVKLDADGSRSEIVRVLRDPALNEQLWPALPELTWIARPAFAKPGATTLLYADDARKDAVVAVHSYGAGRVLYIGSDNTWRWRYKVGDRVHAVFWSQAMRWGTSNRLTGNPRLKVGLDRRQIRPGENLEVIARPRDRAGAAVANALVIAELEDRTRQQHVQLQPVADSGGLYRGVLQNIGAGVHSIKIKVQSPDFEGIEETLQVISREVTGQEGVELSRDTARLASLAQAGSGRSLDILEARQLFKELAGQGKIRTVESSYELWSSYWALLLVVALLAAEWLLRKKMGMA
ncbi:MAG TPA: hypothetical protein VEK08_02535 [Planctomycetota bacterium]|nr:hypothetical protein [Planctomycetota bacterium]